jgi:hypothetical protein
LDFLIDRPDDVTGQQIVNDDGPILQECSNDLIGRGVSLDPLELAAAHW